MIMAIPGCSSPSANCLLPASSGMLYVSCGVASCIETPSTQRRKTTSQTEPQTAKKQKHKHRSIVPKTTTDLLHHHGLLKKTHRSVVNNKKHGIWLLVYYWYSRIEEEDTWMNPRMEQGKEEAALLSSQFFLCFSLSLQVVSPSLKSRKRMFGKPPPPSPPKRKKKHVLNSCCILAPCNYIYIYVLYMSFAASRSLKTCAPHRPPPLKKQNKKKKAWLNHHPPTHSLSWSRARCQGAISDNLEEEEGDKSSYATKKKKNLLINAFVLSFVCSF